MFCSSALLIQSIFYFRDEMLPIVLIMCPAHPLYIEGPRMNPTLHRARTRIFHIHPLSLQRRFHGRVFTSLGAAVDAPDSGAATVVFRFCIVIFMHSLLVCIRLRSVLSDDSVVGTKLVVFVSFFSALFAAIFDTFSCIVGPGSLLRWVAELELHIDDCSVVLGM
jgi:hypothetical protein